jgi:hypothetical protein
MMWVPADAAGGPAGAEQNRQGFKGQARPLVQHGEQDLVGKRHVGGRPMLARALGLSGDVPLRLGF